MQKLKERLMKYIFLISALASILAVAFICLFLFVSGIPAVAEIGVFNFLLGKEWSPGDIPALFGIFPMILGSLYVTAGAIVIGVPIGLFTAVFMANTRPQANVRSKWIYRILKPSIDLLAGIPSVIYGFFGIVVLVPLVRGIFGGTGSSILTASLLLGIMILPTIITISESALRAVPAELYAGAIALGASHERATFAVVLPAAKSGVMAAVVLGIGRAIGETMAVKMVAGNQPLIRMPDEITKGVRTLTANIVIEMGYAADLHKEALIATGVVLFTFILIINLLFSLLKKDGSK